MSGNTGGGAASDDGRRDSMFGSFTALAAGGGPRYRLANTLDSVSATKASTSLSASNSSSVETLDTCRETTRSSRRCEVMLSDAAIARGCIDTIRGILLGGGTVDVGAASKYKSSS